MSVLQNESRGGNKEAGPLLWSPFEILNGRIVDSDVKPTYRIIGTDVTSYKTVYNYSCTLYGLYGRCTVYDDCGRDTLLNNNPVVFYFGLNQHRGPEKKFIISRFADSERDLLAKEIRVLFFGSEFFFRNRLFSN